MKVPLDLTRLGDDSDGAPAYESMLDLFTLLSFILIIASFFFVASASHVENASQSVHSYLAGRGTGPAPSLPDKIILLIVSKENGEDILTIVDSGSQPQRNVLKSPPDLSFLKTWRSRLSEANEVSITMLWRGERPSPLVLEELQRWFVSADCKYNVIFVGEYARR